MATGDAETEATLAALNATKTTDEPVIPMETHDYVSCEEDNDNNDDGIACRNEQRRKRYRETKVREEDKTDAGSAVDTSTPSGNTRHNEQRRKQLS